MRGPWCSLLCASLWLSPAAAEPGRSRVILVDPGVDALSHRLREEIESLGFELDLVGGSEPERPLELRARNAGAVAAIRVSQSGEGAVEMTIVDRTTGKTVSRRLAITTAADPASAELIATRTVELLRASLMELAAAHPARGDAEVTPEVQALTPRLERERVASFAFALGPGVAHTTDFRASADVWASLSLLTSAGAGATAQIFVPLTAARLDGHEGSVDVSASRYRLGGVLDLGARSRFGARFTAGVLVARLALSGSADTPYYGVEDDLVVWGPWLGAALRVRVSESFRALLGADTALVFPRTVVRAAGREVATWGRPGSSGVAGMEVVLP